MAERPVWRGHLRLALVSCPVALHSVLRANGNLRFHFINPKTGHRVRMVTLDAETDGEVPRRDLVKGYEFEKDRYVLLDDEDFASAKIETSTTMTVDKFVARDAIQPIYFDTSYFMVPDGVAGQDVYVVLRDAIAESGRAALSRVVIARRERAVAILPLENGMVLHTLHEPRDLYDYNKLFDLQSDTGKYANKLSRDWFNAANRNKGRAGKESMNSLLDAMHEDMKSKGLMKESELLRQGRRDYARYKKFKFVTNPLAALAAYALTPKNKIIEKVKDMALRKIE